MATIIPFKAVRSKRDKVGLFATRTYLSYSEKGLSEKLNNNPYTFLQIINPDFKEKSKLKGKNKFKSIKEKYHSFLKQEILFKEEKESLYIYCLNHEGFEYKGIIAATPTKEYEEGIIKKHEKTITKRENIFTEYLSNIKFNADPVLLSHKSCEDINKLINEFTLERPEYEFTTSNKALHRLWVVSNSSDINKLVEKYKKIKSLYIADGHHRSASSNRLSKKGGPNYFMCFLIDEKKINVYSFHRSIKNLKKLNLLDLKDQLSKKFDVKEVKTADFQTEEKNEILVYLHNKILSIVPKKESYEENSISSLSYNILNKNIFEEIFNLNENSEEIKYLNGKSSIQEILIQKEKQKEDSIIFFLKPIPINEIRKISDKNLTLPPKSTYIEPKLRSGLTILDLK